MEIPERIKNFNFVLIDPEPKDIALKGKKPLEKAWQKKEHRFNDPVLLEHLAKGYNYGVRAGKTSPIVIGDKSYFLVILDFDKKEVQDKVIDKLPETFTTTSGSKKNCLHLWFASDNDKGFKILDEDKDTLCDIVGEGNQLIAPGSKHSSGSTYSIVKDLPFAFVPYAELQALLLPFDKTPKKPIKEKKVPSLKNAKGGVTDKILSGVSMKEVLDSLGIDTSKNPTNCPLHTSKQGKCLSWNNETAHCFHCQSEHEGWNKFSLVREAKNLNDKQTFEWFAEKTGLQEELKKSRKEYVKNNPAIQGEDKESNDLKTFIFDKNQIIGRRVFSSHRLGDKDFAFGLLLPREEDFTDSKGNVLGQKQVWRPCLITSQKRGLPVSKWLEKEYKVSYEAIPSEMKLRWELADIDNYLHKPSETISGLRLFNKIREKYEKYLYFMNKEWYSINALWDMGTYLHQLFSVYPIKEERGLKGTAKSKTMTISSYISLNGTEIMINPSESTLFRLTEELRPTKYIDEAEKLFRITKQGIESDSRVELINSSYSSNGVVPRQESVGKKYITKWYHSYSPTRVGSINGLYGATEDRAITQIHTKAPDKDKRGETEPENDKNCPSWSEIRNECYLWSLQNWEKVHNEYLGFSIETKIKKRDLQLWKPLLVLAKLIDQEKLYPEVLAFAEAYSERKKIDNLSEGTLDYKLLNCLNEVLQNENAENKILIDNIRKKFNTLYCESGVKGKEEKDTSFNKTITNRLDKIGFRETKGRKDKGMFYELTKEKFDEIVSPITSDFTTLPTLPTLHEDKPNKINVDSMKENEGNKKNTNVANVKNVGNVGTLAIKNTDDFLEIPEICANCGNEAGFKSGKYSYCSLECQERHRKNLNDM